MKKPSKVLILLSTFAIAISLLSMVIGAVSKNDTTIRSAGIIGLCNLTILSCNVSTYCKKKKEYEKSIKG